MAGWSIARFSNGITNNPRYGISSPSSIRISFAGFRSAHEVLLQAFFHQLLNVLAYGIVDKAVGHIDCERMRQQYPCLRFADARGPQINKRQIIKLEDTKNRGR